jgi:hypothetical protein
MQVLLVLLLFAVGCGEREKPARPSSQRVRDSVLGSSKLPGAAGVRGAIRAADSAAARNARLDSIDR